MRVLVTGSSGHLGEALMRTLPAHGLTGIGFDIKPGTLTHHVGSITSTETVRTAMTGVDAILHTATLHKPHVATHSRQDFVDVNVTGTLTLLDAAKAAGVRRFVFTSTTSAFGSALRSKPGEPAGWIDEAARGLPKNIYGATKIAAEELCALAHTRDGMSVLVLRTSRFFPEEDDDPAKRAAFSDANAKANEFLNRRVDIEDAASAHIAALSPSLDIGFDKFIISATTPFSRAEADRAGRDVSDALKAVMPDAPAIYRSAGFALPDRLDRIYDNTKARALLGWTPQWDFAAVLDQIAGGEPIGSQLARDVGIKRYHAENFAEGPYPVDDAPGQ